MKQGYCVRPKNSRAAQLKPPPKRRSTEVRILLELQEKRCDSKMSFKIKITPLLMCIRASRLRFLFSSHQFVFYLFHYLLPVSLVLFSLSSCSPYIFSSPPTWSVFLYFLRSLPPITHFLLPFSSPFISLLRLSHIFSKGSEVNQVGDHVFSVCLCVQPIRTAAGNWEHWFICIISLRWMSGENDNDGT